MATAVIEVEDLGKRYTLGETVGRRSVGEALVGGLRRLGRRPARDELWSLRDVSFEVAEGEAIGVVGRNGAGKSTLLKILSRITEPTTGVARVYGRVGSLLEVGTGFHPELTGRENTYLNGAILGMPRREIDRRFDEIVEFAGVARFLDTPIKRYSSGMYLRLAFAVAAHLDPDILVVDEVLAVGDAEFQRRCLGKMATVEQEGRTVVFVSHDMGAISRLCQRAIWLDHGAVEQVGPTNEVVQAYLASAAAAGHARFDDGLGSGPFVLHEVVVVDGDGRRIDHVLRDQAFAVELHFELRERVRGFDASVLVTTSRGVRLLDESWSDAVPEDPGAPGRYVARVTVPPMLNVGDHTIGVWFGTRYETFVYEPEVVRIGIDGSDADRPDRAVCLGLPWDVERVDGSGR